MPGGHLTVCGATLQVLKSDLYDTELQMYKVSASLAKMSTEIGRMVAFPPGWLENESIWLHMSYKYYLELLRAGLYDQFFEEIKTGLVAFMDPKIMGRSPLECSSFIASSAHPDKTIHGQGYLARLSGSTAEFLSMWNEMMYGSEPFYVDEDGDLNLKLVPALPTWLFKDGRLSFMFIGAVNVTYYNPSYMHSWNNTLGVSKTVITSTAGESITFGSAVIPAPYAKAVRDYEYPKVDMYFGES